VDVSLAIRRRLEELGLEQKGLARAARVTESYVSQLLARKKAPPAPARTDIYDKMDRYLKLPRGELARIASAQRKELLDRQFGAERAPLYRDVRALILRKCVPAGREPMRAIFEQQSFGEMERLVAGKVLDLVKRVILPELDHDAWLRRLAGLAARSEEERRVAVLDFLDTDLFGITGAQCDTFLDPLVMSWDLDLATFALDVRLNQRMAAEPRRRFEFIERTATEEEPGFRDFLHDRTLSGSATGEELEFLKRLRFRHRRPTALYYYRELQGLRDPIHFRAG